MHVVCLTTAVQPCSGAYAPDVSAVEETTRGLVHTDVELVGLTRKARDDNECAVHRRFSSVVSSVLIPLSNGRE
jgi:hypothetical protein